MYDRCPAGLLHTASDHVVSPGFSFSRFGLVQAVGGSLRLCRSSTLGVAWLCSLSEMSVPFRAVGCNSLGDMGVCVLVRLSNNR